MEVCPSPYLFFYLHENRFFFVVSILETPSHGSYKVLQVLEVLEFFFLKLNSWKDLENSHIFEEVL